jgi:hypothetical protein
LRSFYLKSRPIQKMRSPEPVPAFWARPYTTFAVSGVRSTAGVRLCGRIRAKAARKIPYAASTPNAIEPTDAQINIMKFNRSAIFSASVEFT